MWTQKGPKPLRNQSISFARVSSALECREGSRRSTYTQYMSKSVSVPRARELRTEAMTKDTYACPRHAMKGGCGGKVEEDLSGAVLASASY